MKKILIVIIFSCLLNCNSTKQKINIKFSNSTQEVTLFYSKRMNTISVISLPFNLEVTNQSSKKEAFRNYTYKYGNKLKGNPIKLYLMNNNKFAKQSFSKQKHIDSKRTNKYLITSKHFIDTTKFNRLFFKPYIEKMKRKNQDTLNIGTIAQLKIKHKDLLEQLVKNDSVSLLFLNQDTKSSFKKITIPVTY